MNQPSNHQSLILLVQPLAATNDVVELIEWYGGSMVVLKLYTSYTTSLI